jgi:hypothetical protein
MRRVIKQKKSLGFILLGLTRLSARTIAQSLSSLGSSIAKKRFLNVIDKIENRRLSSECLNDKSNIG